jgi:hypothetical protein
VQRPHPTPDMALPISVELYQRLVSASVKSGFEKEAWEIAPPLFLNGSEIMICGKEFSVRSARYNRFAGKSSERTARYSVAAWPPGPT